MACSGGTGTGLVVLETDQTLHLDTRTSRLAPDEGICVVQDCVDHSHSVVPYVCAGKPMVHGPEELTRPLQVPQFPNILRL